MKPDRKRIGLTALATFAVLLAAGCSKTPPEPPAPPPVETEVVAPTQDVTPAPTPDTSADRKEMPPPPSLSEIQRRAEEAGLLGDVFFDFDRYQLRSQAKERLAKNAEFLKGEGSNLLLTIEGHCDERGTNEYNLALGQQRSTTAVDYLVSLGVDRSRFKTVSYGEERPFCTASNEGCWQKNRRARFVVSGQR